MACADCRIIYTFLVIIQLLVCSVLDGQAESTDRNFDYADSMGSYDEYNNIVENTPVSVKLTSLQSYSNHSHPSLSLTTEHTGSTNISELQFIATTTEATFININKNLNIQLPSDTTSFTTFTSPHSISQFSSSSLRSYNVSMVQYPTSSAPRQTLSPSNTSPTARTTSTTYFLPPHSLTGTEPTYFTTNDTQRPPLSPRPALLHRTRQHLDGLVTTGTTDLFDASSLLKDLICPSEDCLNLSGSMLSLMDHVAEPCDDFYRYACGGLQDNPEMLDQDAGSEVNRRLTGQVLSTSGRGNSSYEKLKMFYDSCFTYKVVQNQAERIDEVIAELQKIGLFYSKDSWDARPVDITDLLTDFFTLDSTPLFDILLDEDETNTSKFVLKLVPPVTTPLFPKKRRALDKNACAKNLAGGNTKKQMAGQKTTENFTLFLESLQKLNVSNSSDTIAETLQNLQDNIADVVEKYLPFDDYFRWISVTKKYNVMTVADLQSNYTMVNWTRLISQLLNQEVDSSTKVHVYYMSYLEQLFHYLSEINSRLLHNSLLAMYAKELYDNILTPASSDRKEYCLTVLKELLPDVAGSLYLKTFPENTTHHLRQVFDQVKCAMEEQINGSTWLDEQSKTSVLEKLASLDVVAGGGRDILGNPRLLDHRMEDCEITNTSYLSNVMNLKKRRRRLLYALYSDDASADEQLWTYFVSPLRTQPPLFYKKHQIVVPYAILPKPRVGSVLSQYSAAELGVTLARMIAHHFDFTGISYGVNGTREDIVSATFYQRYMSDVKHLASEEVSKIDKSVYKHRRSRSLLVNDFTSDNAALNMALQVFKSDNKTNKELQLFFLAMAQAACQKQTMWDEPAPASLHLELPLPIRVNSVFAQSPHFSSAFRCSVDSGMNARKKIPTFPEGPRLVIAT